MYRIIIDPSSGVIIVSQSAWDSAVGEGYLRNRQAFMKALIKELQELIGFV